MNGSCCNQLAGVCVIGIPAQVGNFPMGYNSQGGTVTPTSLGITPPFQNLVAYITDITGVGSGYTWSPATGTWN